MMFRLRWRDVLRMAAWPLLALVALVAAALVLIYLR